MPLISLCMIVRNEEAVLGRCLDSVADLVDEIILVDTGSTDNTKAVAAEYAAKIYDFPWCDDFSAARNYAVSQAVGDYWLWLDKKRSSIPHRAEFSPLLPHTPATTHTCRQNRIFL